MKICKIILFFLLLSYTFTAQAHTVIGENKKETIENINIVQDFIYSNYGLVLEKDVIVINEPNIEAYTKRLAQLKIKNAEAVARRSQALTSKANIIIMDQSGLNKKMRLFFLAHELIHLFQFQYLKENAFDDMALLEGFADIIASDISGYKIDIVNYNISYKDLKKYQDFQIALEKYGANKVYAQSRYYAINKNFKKMMENHNV